MCSLMVISCNGTDSIDKGIPQTLLCSPIFENEFGHQLGLVTAAFGFLQEWSIQHSDAVFSFCMGWLYLCYALSYNQFKTLCNSVGTLQ